MSETPKDSVKSFSSDESDRRRKSSKEFRKSNFYIVQEEEGEGASKKSKTKLGDPKSSPNNSTRSREKYVSHSSEYYTSPKKIDPHSLVQSLISPTHTPQYPEESFQLPYYSIHSPEYTPQTPGNIPEPHYSPKPPGYVFHSPQYTPRTP